MFGQKRALVTPTDDIVRPKRLCCIDLMIIQSPKLVDLDLTKDSRHLSSCQMTHVLNNIANQWQILVHFSSFAMSIWRLSTFGTVLPQKDKMQTHGQHGNIQEPNLNPLNDN